MPDKIERLVESQRALFRSGATKSIDFRIHQLRLLEQLCAENEEEIVQAVIEDLGRDYFDGFMSEVGSIVWEIRYVLRNLRGWMRSRRIPTPLSLAPASARMYPEPKGCCLIIGTWNYPIHLVLKPLIGAVAAGNCCIVKPGEQAVKSSALLAKIIPRYFDSNSVAVVVGDGTVGSRLLEHRFDQIFFSGSRHIGRTVMARAARHLTPVALELGGSNPCVVTPDTRIETTARRIAWAALFNTGQTCLAPGFVVAHRSIAERLTQSVITQIRDFYDDDPEQNIAYGKIISTENTERIESLLAGQDIRWGGKVCAADRYVEPTIVASHDWDNPLVVEEVLGPVITFLEYSDIDDVLRRLQTMEKPLALYLFTENRPTIRKFESMSSSGALVVNDLMVHAATSTIPVGGTGGSGFGSYHGRAGFDAFSHLKPVLRRRLLFDWSIRYPPHTKPGKLLRKILRTFM